MIVILVVFNISIIINSTVTTIPRQEQQPERCDAVFEDALLRAGSW